MNYHDVEALFQLKPLRISRTSPTTITVRIVWGLGLGRSCMIRWYLGGDVWIPNMHKMENVLGGNI